MKDLARTAVRVTRGRHLADECAVVLAAGSIPHRPRGTRAGWASQRPPSGVMTIGLATARRFVPEGAHVFITGRRQSELDQAKTQLGVNVTAVQGDAANLDAIGP